ncbi:MAG TPA: HD-GYP domain-containing protein [Gammaproteobacteria bacterium]|nr:HD-GYP domain-containing protein [Gammaproteobacteria bacterium]
MSELATKLGDNRLAIDVANLRIGMYVSVLDRPWLETPFLFQGFLIRAQGEIDELRKHCKQVVIDVDQTDPAVDVKSLAVPAPRKSVETPATMELPSYPATAAKKPASKKQACPPPVTVDAHHSVYSDISELRRELASARDQHDRASLLVREVMDNLSNGGKLDVKTAESAVLPIVESVMKNESAMSWLVRLRETSDYLYTHSVSSAIWATVMARHLGMPKDALEAIGLGAMLLDIGKTKLPPEILSKPGPLTDDELAIARRHVEHGIEILEESGGVDERVLAMVRTHHERHDGSGYPRGLLGQQIPVHGRIAGIVDFYDAVTSKRPYADAQSSYDCLRSLNKLAGTAFQTEMVEQFIQSIGFFPPGTLVQLNDGSVAVVIAQNRRHRLKPEILLLLDPKHTMRRDFPMIDLQLEARSSYNDQVLYIDKGLEPGSFGIDPAEYFLG